MPQTTQPTGVILMTYGSATTSKDVEPFLKHVYPNASPDLIMEFQRRFDIVGSSPLIEITVNQAKALQDLLNLQAGQGTFVVAAGMLHSRPFIDDAMRHLKAAGCSRVLGVLLSPQYSPHIMRGYDQALAAAGRDHGFPGRAVTMLGSWETEPKFIDMLAVSLAATRAELAGRYHAAVPVIFTTHSLPEAVVKRDPSYLQQLQRTVDAVVARAQLAPGEWHTAYQSAGHTPEEWLKPDLNDVIAELKGRNIPGVLVVPIQFLADHLEILYDLDTAAREETEALGVHYHRLPVANLNPQFIAALADIVSRGQAAQ